jgi:H+/Cl- antiporter ClcA
MVLFGGLVGALGVLAAFCLSRLIGLALNLFWFGRIGFKLVEPHNSPWAGQWWTALLPVFGAAVIGIMLKYGSRMIAGHGIPEAMEAVLYKESKMQAKVAILKPLSAAVSIGSGGPYGAEGPIIMTGGAIGSLFGQLLKLTPDERKVLLAAGAAAGMVAIFGTPLAAVLLVTELLLFEWSVRALIPVSLAAVIATALRGPVMGDGGRLFPDVNVVPLTVAHLPWYLLFAVVAGVGAAGLTWLLYWIEDLYEAIPWLTFATRPVLGALLVGVVGIFFPRALGVGYDNIGGILGDKFGVGLILAILIGKFMAWSLSLGSGTSGGVLAPVLMIGGAVGGLLGHLTQGASGLPPGLVALVVMAGLFGASTRAPFAAVLFAAEVTGHFDALVPILFTVAVATSVATRLLPYSIMTGKLVRRGRVVVQDYSAPTPTIADGKAVMHGDRQGGLRPAR